MANMKLVVISLCSIAVAILVGAPQPPSSVVRSLQNASHHNLSSHSPAPRATSAQVPPKPIDMHLWIEKFAPTASTVKTGGDEILNPISLMNALSFGFRDLGTVLAKSALSDIKKVIDGTTGQKVVIAVAMATPGDAGAVAAPGDDIYMNVIVGDKSETGLTVPHESEWLPLGREWAEGPIDSDAVMKPKFGNSSNRRSSMRHGRDASLTCLRTMTFTWPSTQEPPPTPVPGIIGIFVGYVPNTEFDKVVLSYPKSV